MKIQIEKIRDEDGKLIHTIREREVKIVSMYPKNNERQIIEIIWDRDPNFEDEGIAFVSAGNALYAYWREYTEAVGLDEHGKINVSEIKNAKVTRYYFDREEKKKLAKLAGLPAIEI